MNNLSCKTIFILSINGCIVMWNYWENVSYIKHSSIYTKGLNTFPGTKYN